MAIGHTCIASTAWTGTSLQWRLIWEECHQKEINVTRLFKDSVYLPQLQASISPILRINENGVLIGTRATRIL